MSNIGIYKITSPTNKVYIGQSWDIKNRMTAYQYLKCKDQPRIYNSLLKHGWPAHTFDVLMNVSENITQQMFDAIEQAYMDYYRKNGFELLNLKEGGSNGKHSEETKKKIGSTRLGVDNPMFGKKDSEETRLKRSLAQTGHAPSRFRTVSQYDREGNLIAHHDSLRSAAKTIGGQHGCISGCCTGKRKHHLGFVWKYKEEEK